MKINNRQHIEDRLHYFAREGRKYINNKYQSHEKNEYGNNIFKIHGTYFIDLNFRVNVEGDVRLGGIEDEELGIEFGEITGSFSIIDCPNLNTLKGLPKKVKNRVIIENCPKLNSLDYIKEVRDLIIKDCPSINSISNVSKMKLNTLTLQNLNIENLSSIKSMTSLKKLYLIDCKNLINLKGIEYVETKSKFVRGASSASNYYEGGIYLINLPKLKSLMYLPKNIKGNLVLENLPLNSLEHIPETIEGMLELISLHELTKLDVLPQKLGSLKINNSCKIIDIVNISNCEIKYRVDLNPRLFPRRLIKKLIPSFKGVIGMRG